VGCASADATSGATTGAPPQVAGQSSSPIKGGPDLATNPFDPPDSPYEVIYGRDFRSRPLPALNAIYPVTAEEAIANAAQNGFGAGHGWTPGTPTATLRQVTVGSGSQAVTGPAWVLIWKGSPVVIVGKATFIGEQRTMLADQASCEFLVVIDANTGDGHRAGQICR
jgi:hypothetical protein